MPNEAQKRRLVLLVHHMRLLLRFFSPSSKEKASREGETIPYVTCSNSSCVMYITIPFAHFSLPARNTLQRLFIRCTYSLSVSGDIVAVDHDFLTITDGYCHDNYPNRRCLHPYHIRSPKDIIDHLRTQVLLDSFRCCSEFRV